MLAHALYAYYNCNHLHELCVNVNKTTAIDLELKKARFSGNRGKVLQQ